jgi:hypothetical protein
VLSLDVRVVTITMIKMLAEEQLNTNRHMHRGEEVKRTGKTQECLTAFFMFHLSEV